MSNRRIFAAIATPASPASPGAPPGPWARSLRARGFAAAIGALAAVGALGGASGTARADEGVATTPLVPVPVAPLRACSFRHEVCVHGVPGDPILEALGDLERTWDAATGPLGLPAPAHALATGTYDVFLARELEAAGATYLRERDRVGARDRASAFSLVDARLHGCSLERALARELFRAIAFRTSPATDDATARGEASALTRLTVPCALGAPDGAELLQAHPERGLYPPPFRTTEGFRLRAGDGAGLFFSWLDDRFAQTPGGLVRALLAMSTTKTARDADAFGTEPDVFDVLRESTKGMLASGSTINDVLLSFAVARTFVGRGATSESAELGAIGAPLAPDFDLPWPKLGSPRSVTMSAGLSPTGMTSIVVRRAGAPPGQRLRVEIEWEALAKLRFVAVKLDANGAILQQLPFGVAEKGTSCALSVGELDATDAVVLVGTNVGSSDEPLDPETTPREPHGWVVSIGAESP